MLKLKRASDVLGLPIVNINNGNQIGIVKDVICEINSDVIALIIEAKTLFHDGKAIHISDINNIGNDAITVLAEDIIQTVIEIEQKHKDSRTLYNHNKLHKNKILTTNGNELGTLEDVYFCEELGTIVGYELSEGIMTDIKEGKKYLHKPETIVEGENVLIVPMSSKENLEDRSDS